MPEKPFGNEDNSPIDDEEIDDEQDEEVRSNKNTLESPFSSFRIMNQHRILPMRTTDRILVMMVNIFLESSNRLWFSSQYFVRIYMLNVLVNMRV